MSAAPSSSAARRRQLSSGEIAPRFRHRPHLTHSVFDFDGTLSMLRHGWPDVMLELFMELLPRQAGEDDASLRRELLHEIFSFNGRQTIHQMKRFAERVAERGHDPKPAESYLAEYTDRLAHRIEDRSARIRSGAQAREDFLVFQAREILTALHARGLTLVLLSGTVEKFVRQEAALLGIDHFFGRHLYGGHEDHTKFSKQLVFDRLLREEGISGGQLISFGDGPVEIRHASELGGLPIAVASDETDLHSGKINEHKAVILREAGAEIVIPDYRNADELLNVIFHE